MNPIIGVTRRLHLKQPTSAGLARLPQQLFFDPVGGDAFQQSLRCINWEGRIIIIGFAGGTIQQVPSNYILLKNCSIVGALWGAYRRKDPATMRASLDAMIGWFADGKLKPHSSHQLPLEQAGEAMQLMLDRKSTGKIVLTTGKG